MKILAFIGLLTIGVIVSGIFGTLFAMLDDDETRRERWSRTLDEADYFKVNAPKFLKKDESAPDTNVGNISTNEKEKE